MGAALVAILASTSFAHAAIFTDRAAFLAATADLNGDSFEDDAIGRLAVSDASSNTGTLAVFDGFRITSATRRATIWNLGTLVSDGAAAAMFFENGVCTFSFDEAVTAFGFDIVGLEAPMRAIAVLAGRTCSLSRRGTSAQPSSASSATFR